MKRIPSVLVFGACLLMATSSTLPAATGLHGKDQPLEGAYKASDLVGKFVKNLQGEDLGQLEDVVIKNTGEVGYAVLSFGGFLGMGDTLFAVPWTALAHSPEGDHLTLDVQPEKLEQAPGFKREYWPDMDDEQWRLAISEFYLASGNQPKSAKAAPGMRRHASNPDTERQGKESLTVGKLPDYSSHAHLSAKKGYLVGGEGKTGNSVRYDGSQIWEGPGYAVVDVEPQSDQGMVMGIVRTHDHTYTIMFTVFSGRESFMNGGIATNLSLHGTTGNGAPLFPQVFAPVAGWGKATVFKDDDILYKQYSAHFMVTEGVRDETRHQVHFLEPERLKSFIMASGKEGSGEKKEQVKQDINTAQQQVNPHTLQLHMVAHSESNNSDNIPPYDEFIHFMWDRIIWENQE